MKKYFIRYSAIILAFGLIAFTNLKHTNPKALTYRFLLSTPSVDANIFATSSNRFSYWIITTHSVSLLCDAGSDIACVIEVDAKYTHDYGLMIGRRLNSSDPDAGGPELPFPMQTANGILTGGIQYRIVSNTTSLDTKAYNAVFSSP